MGSGANRLNLSSVFKPGESKVSVRLVLAKLIFYNYNVELMKIIQLILFEVFL